MNPPRIVRVADVFDIFTPRAAASCLPTSTGFLGGMFYVLRAVLPYFLVARFCLAYRWFILQRLWVRMMFSCVLFHCFRRCWFICQFACRLLFFFITLEISCLNIPQTFARLTKPCCIFFMGCWGVIRHIFVPSPIANAMNGKKAFAPRSAKIRITGLENYTRMWRCTEIRIPRANP